VRAVPFTLLSLNTSPARPLDINGRTVLSGIGKRSVDGPRAVARLGIEGDDRPTSPCMAASARRSTRIRTNTTRSGRRFARSSVSPAGTRGCRSVRSART
jgi:hypothetical protein